MITNDHYQLARMVNTGIDAAYNENVQPYRLISSNVVYSFFSYRTVQVYEYKHSMYVKRKFYFTILKRHLSVENVKSKSIFMCLDFTLPVKR